MERVARGGLGGFVLNGWNVCRPLGDVLDFRMRWGFSGEGGEVRELVERMRLFVPTVVYDGRWSLGGWV